MPSETIWIVVLAQSGISTLVGAYRDEKTALSHSQALSKDMNSDYDDVGIFIVEVGAQPSDCRIA